MNHRPSILQPENTTDLSLVMSGETEHLTVLASDPEDEPVFFWWTLPTGETPDYTVGQADQDGIVIYYTNLSVARDPRLDGRTIQLLVTDGNEGNEQFLRWAVEVPQ